MSEMKRLLEAVDSMSQAAKKERGPEFPGYWRGSDPASKAKSKMVGSDESKGSILKDLSNTAKATATQRRLKEEFENFKQEQPSNPRDAVKLDVPLLIRIMEYAREDAKTDMDLHNVAERLIELSRQGRTLGMQDYDAVVKAEVNEYGNAQNPNTQTTTPGANGAAQADAENDAQSQTTDAAMQKNVAALKTIQPELNVNQAKTAVQKTDVPGAQLTPGELAQTKNLSGIIEPALSDPQIGPQMTALLRKAGQLEKAAGAKPNQTVQGKQ